MQIFARLMKVDEATRRVYGRATQEVPDRSGEIFDYESSKPNFEKWSGEIAKATDGKSVGNVRAMHGKVAAGKLNEITFNDVEKAIDICAEVVDDAEWIKVQKGVYSGFSVGGSYARKWNDAEKPQMKRFTAVPTEISLVDFPCVPTANFDLVKADGMVAQVPIVGDPEATAVDAIAKLFDAGTLKPTELLAKIEADQAVAAEAAKVTALEELRKAVANDQITNGEIEKLAAAHMTVEQIAAVSGEGPTKSLGLLVELQKMAPPIAADPPAVVAPPSVVVEPLTKGLWTVADLAILVDALAGVRANAAWDAAIEGDGSPVPARLKAVCDELGQILCEMAEEEVQELAEAEKAARSEKVTGVRELLKVGKRNSKADQDRVQAIHDHAANMGADCAAEKAATGRLAKALGMTDVDDEALQKHVTVLRAKAKNWDDLPAAPKGVLRVVEKVNDGVTLSDADALNKAREDELHRAAESGDPLAMTKFVMKYGAQHGAAPLNSNRK
jgi:hypothetical protein